MRILVFKNPFLHFDGKNFLKYCSTVQLLPIGRYIIVKACSSSTFAQQELLNEMTIIAKTN